MKWGSPFHIMGQREKACEKEMRLMHFLAREMLMWKHMWSLVKVCPGISTYGIVN